MSSSPVTNGESITNLPWTPNIAFSHSIILDAPIDQVYPVLGTDKGYDRAARLNPFCTLFEMGGKDTVAIPSANDFHRTSVREQPAASEGGDLANRRQFVLEETVPVFLGLNSKIRLNGTLSWLETNVNPGSPLYSIYETVAEGSFGIKIWKVFKFEEVVEGEPAAKKTKVTEEVRGSMPRLLAGISQSKGAKAHKEHVESYRKLFEGQR